MDAVAASKIHDEPASRMVTILFDGIAYGMLLFILACGLSVTLGLMNFVNLAHGAFALAGGYITANLMNRLGVSFYLCLPVAFLFSAAIGVLLDVIVMRRSEDALVVLGLSRNGYGDKPRPSRPPPPPAT